MIPKIIHYCWFGGNEKSELIKKCMDSWKKYCPDYEIVEWNETNFDISFCKYTEEAYKAKKWAFVSDVARLYAVYTRGGVYLDTDVELHKNLDSMLQYSGFFGFESARVINTGMGFGAEKGNTIVNAMIQPYLNKTFIKDDETYNMEPCPRINTDAIEAVCGSFQRNNQFQLIKGVAFLDTVMMRELLTHHYAGSWGDGTKSKKKYRSNIVIRYLRNPSKFNYIEKRFGKKIMSVYQFMVYDLYDFGIMYYVKRKRNKVKK